VGVAKLSGRRAGDGERHRVDREVAAGQVVVQRAGLHLGQRSRRRIALAPGGGEVDADAARQLERRGPEPRVDDQAGAERGGEPARDGQRVALHHQVEVRPRRQPQQGVAHGAAHEPQPLLPGERRGQARAGGERPPGSRRIPLVVYDPVSRKLSGAAPVANAALIAAIAGFEGLTLAELTARFAACEASFRAWVGDPVNAGRPISEAPDYVDRIALDSLIERRMWHE
jgi:hypothetical protein